ncbi:MAG: DUF1549 domain-containing protein [Planctomycetaceae bacterium]
MQNQMNNAGDNDHTAPDGSLSDPLLSELLDLTNRYCDGLLDPSQGQRLSSILKESAAARRTFIEFIQLHGQLTWDAGHSGAELVRQAAESPVRRQTPYGRRTVAGWLRPTVGLLAALIVLFAARGWWISGRTEQLAANSATPENALNLTASDDNASAKSIIVADGDSTYRGAEIVSRNASGSQPDDDGLPPIRLNAIEDQVVSVHPPEAGAPTALEAETVRVPDTDDQIIEQINALLARSWAENEVPVAIEAPAGEWIRRASLTLTGAIPASSRVRSFSETPAVSFRQRHQAVLEFLSSDRAAEHLAVYWVNLMIGRSNPGRVDEESLYVYMKDRFASNESWMDTVCELMSARGRSDQNGATNFLLAHLNNQATPATAVTARLFLGQQVHCTQCHDHPFSSDVKQNEFWSLNAFFKQTRREPVRLASNSERGDQRIWALTDTDIGGMTFFETLRGQQVAVLPEFAGETLPPEDGVHRREELVRLIRTDPQQRVARAMVNRVWQQFFGAAFTAPVDDMGPHVPVSHPELLDFLADAFAYHNYDVRRLMLWVSLSDAWQKSSRLAEADGVTLATDFLPEAGGMPVFNQVYARQMMPEEVYDSIRTAIRSVARQPIDSSWGTSHRRQWVRQFVESYGTDENDESLRFDGNISQALLMMNGEDLLKDISLAVNYLLADRTRDQLAPSKLLAELSLATVSRMPQDVELKVFQNRIQQVSRSGGADIALQIACEDMLWAYLNCSEFVIVH